MAKGKMIDKKLKDDEEDSDGQEIEDEKSSEHSKNQLMKV